MKSPEHLAQHLAELPRPLLLATDVDGTIAPIAEHPSGAAIAPAALGALQRLAKVDEVHVALITGRDLNALQRMESLDGIWRAVEHGGHVIDPAGQSVRAPLADHLERALFDMRRWLEQSHPDAVVEIKPRGVALHTRQLAQTDPEAAENLLNAFGVEAERLGLHLRSGRHLREVEAEPQNKARALNELRNRLDARSVFFAGDDLTDFDAIALAQEHGAGVFVCSSERASRPAAMEAMWHSVEEMVRFLGALEKTLT